MNIPDELAAAIEQIVSAGIANVRGVAAGSFTAMSIQPEDVELPDLYCNGLLVEIKKYPILFEKIRFQYAQDGDETDENATSFRLPDCRGKILRGTPSTGNNTSAGQTVSEIVDLDAGTTLTYLYVTWVIRAR